jgi:hypothetical protein
VPESQFPQRGTPQTALQNTNSTSNCGPIKTNFTLNWAPKKQTPHQTGNRKNKLHIKLGPKKQTPHHQTVPQKTNSTSSNCAPIKTTPHQTGTPKKTNSTSN